MHTGHSSKYAAHLLTNVGTPGRGFSPAKTAASTPCLSRATPYQRSLLICRISQRRTLPATERILLNLRHRQGHIFPPRPRDNLNANRQALLGRSAANHRRRPAGQIKSHGVAEARKLIVS